MASIGNSPTNVTVIRVEARKSFALGLHLYDSRGRSVNLTGCEIEIVAKPLPLDNTSDATNLLGVNSLANIPVPAAGYAVFGIQAATLDVAAAEYPCAIVLRTADGFSSLIVKAVLDVQENVEFTSVDSMFSSVNPPQSLTVQQMAQGVINVYIGGQLPPGMNYVRDEIMQTIETFDPAALAYVPVGGVAGEVLTKTSGTNYSMEWRPEGNGANGLDATGIPNGQTPVAVGDGTWIWDEIGIDATGVTIGWAPVSNGDNTWSWAEVATATPNWTAGVGAAGEILNKPTLGTASTRADSYFYRSNVLVSEMQGITFQTTVPVSGAEGQIFFVYTP